MNESKSQHAASRAEALRLHKSGGISEALRIYAALLAEDPDDATHLQNAQFSDCGATFDANHCSDWRIGAGDSIRGEIPVLTAFE